MVKPTPDGFHSVTPCIAVRGAREAIDFYKRAFGAEELMVMSGPDGKVMHAEIKIGDSVIFLGDECPDWGAFSPQSLAGSTGSLHIYVDDVDAAFNRALAAGAAVKMPVMDMFWGDRYGKVTDPFGHTWGLATHKEDVSPEECARRQEAWMAEMAAQRPAPQAEAVPASV